MCKDNAPPPCTATQGGGDASMHQNQRQETVVHTLPYASTLQAISKCNAPKKHFMRPLPAAALRNSSCIHMLQLARSAAVPTSSSGQQFPSKARLRSLPTHGNRHTGAGGAPRVYTEQRQRCLIWPEERHTCTPAHTQGDQVCTDSKQCLAPSQGLLEQEGFNRGQAHHTLCSSSQAPPASARKGAQERGPGTQETAIQQ